MTDVEEVRKRYPTAIALPGGVILVHGTQPRQTTFIGATIADLGVIIGKGAGRPLQDKTGLMGRYDISLELDTSSEASSIRPGPMAVMITALQEQLGLKLEPAKENVEVLVIDHVERPSEN